MRNFILSPEGQVLYAKGYATPILPDVEIPADVAAKRPSAEAYAERAHDRRLEPGVHRLPADRRRMGSVRPGTVAGGTPAEIEALASQVGQSIHVEPIDLPQAAVEVSPDRSRLRWLRSLPLPLLPFLIFCVLLEIVPVIVLIRDSLREQGFGAFTFANYLVIADPALCPGAREQRPDLPRHRPAGGGGRRFGRRGDRRQQRALATVESRARRRDLELRRHPALVRLRRAAGHERLYHASVA